MKKIAWLLFISFLGVSSSMAAQTTAAQTTILSCTDSKDATQLMQLTFTGDSVAVKLTDTTRPTWVNSENGKLSNQDEQTPQLAAYDLDGSHAYDCGTGIELDVEQGLLSGASPTGKATLVIAGNLGCWGPITDYVCVRN